MTSSTSVEETATWLVDAVVYEMGEETGPLIDLMPDGPEVIDLTLSESSGSELPGVLEVVSVDSLDTSLLTWEAEAFEANFQWEIGELEAFERRLWEATMMSSPEE